MANTELGLHITDIDCKRIRVEDITTYQELLPVEDPSLYVMMPNTNNWIKTPFVPSGYSVVTSDALCLTDSTCWAELLYLPDGIWKFKYSFKPKDTLYIEYRMMRTCNLEKERISKVVNLDLNADCDNKVPLEKSKLDLVDIHMEAAKANMVSDCYNETMAVKHYNKAKELLDKIDDCSQGC